MALKGNMLIGQSGGPTVVINQSLVGAILEAKKHKQIKNIYGALHGMSGILAEDFIDLRKEKTSDLEAIALTPASALGSARKKPTPDECTKVFEILRKHDIRYFFYIGGNDSAESANIINETAKKVGYELHCFHIPKTIDNDLRENDHTPGFASAAKFVACASMGDNLDSRALPGVKVNVIMGRHAGFLTAASALARVYPDDGPHLIYLPERAFSMDKFVADVERIYKKLGRCIIAVSEGIADESGVAIATKFSKEVDSHGNVQLSGTGALGDSLAQEIKARTKITRVRADTFGYLQRSFPGVYSENDMKEARTVGKLAVQFAVKKYNDGSVAIRRKVGKKYDVFFERIELKLVAKETRHVPDNFINKEGNDVTKAFIEYAKPIVGPLPVIGRFKGVKVKAKKK
ncbi:MAG: 6-phosphofructokinase [Verrucomicrobiota bacterium]|nr:6-phosphofructokinase [Verrucomicrobiota bacterium]